MWAENAMFEWMQLLQHTMLLLRTTRAPGVVNAVRDQSIISWAGPIHGDSGSTSGLSEPNT